MRAVVTVGFGNRPDVGKPGEADIVGTAFLPKLHRFNEAFSKFSDRTRVIVYPELPRGCPPHLEKHYAFKAYALEEVSRNGYDELLWADSSVYPLRSIEPLWELIKQQGYWFQQNGQYTCGEWTADSALEPLGITRAEAFTIPQIAATCFGLDLMNSKAREFLREYYRLAQGTAFCGPWINDRQQASTNMRVRGHRHDQTAASVIVHRLGLNITQELFWEDYPYHKLGVMMVVHR